MDQAEMKAHINAEHTGQTLSSLHFRPLNITHSYLRRETVTTEQLTRNRETISIFTTESDKIVVVVCLKGGGVYYLC